MQRVRDVRSAVAGYTTRSRKLAEHESQSVLVVRNLRVYLCVRAFKIGTGIQGWAPMSGTGDIDDVRIIFFDETVQMDVDEILSRRGPPMAEQPGFDLLRFERFSQKGILKEVDLAYA